MNERNDRFIFLDGFDEGVLHYILPIVAAYAERANVHEIIIYKTDPKFLNEHVNYLGLSKYSLKIRNFRSLDTLRYFRVIVRPAFDFSKTPLFRALFSFHSNQVFGSVREIVRTSLCINVFLGSGIC